MDETMDALRVAGASRTYCRAFRPPDDSSRNYVDVSPLDGGQYQVDSFLTLCYPAGGNNSYPFT
ncbi:MAG: hypothetical protein ACLP6W_06850, partial [Bryobacteraceae bacterium]